MTSHHTLSFLHPPLRKGDHVLHFPYRCSIVATGSGTTLSYDEEERIQVVYYGAAPPAWSAVLSGSGAGTDGRSASETLR